MLVCPKCAGVYPVAEGFCPMDGAPLQARAERQAEEDPVGEGLLGTVLDRRYRLDELIGSGGMAFVYRATHTLIGKKHAIKVMRPELARDPELVRRFLREAQVVSSIKHPNVVDISDFGTRSDGRAFYVMEFLRGRTLADRIDNGGGPLQPEEALGIALQICQGLQAAHDQGVVHRDLKPENIFICDAKPGKEPQVKLLDFGIARAGQRITIAGAVLGTPEYMSPEQAKGLDVDHRADIYGLGVILFEMLTGLVPFRSDDVALTMQSHIHAEPPTLASINTELAYLARTDQALRKLLAKDPDDRPRAAKSAAELLRDAIRGDLGDETATRLVKATMAIGSGGIGLQALGEREEEDPDAIWRERPNKPWDQQMSPARGFGAEAPSPAYPGAAMPLVHSALQAEGVHAGAMRVAGLDPGDTARRRRPRVPLIMGGTALVAAVVTVGMYGALGGFAGLSAAAETPVTETIAIPAAEVPPSVPVVADPHPREVEEKRPVTEPVEAGGQEGEQVAAGNEAGAAPSEETVPQPTSVSTQSDEGNAATEAKSKARKTKLDADERPPQRGSKTNDSAREPTAPPPQKTSESKENTPKKTRAPGDLKDPFGRN
jgi:tRNA A-37 threonylcarbamoyl transferase component Bud32